VGPIYSREQEILDVISSLIDDGDPFTPSMDPGMFEEEFSRSPKFRRGVLDFLRDMMPDPRMRGAGKAQYGGGRSKGLNTGFFGKFDTRQKDYNCRVKGNC
jgi:hypothetical protein